MIMVILVAAATAAGVGFTRAAKIRKLNPLCRCAQTPFGEEIVFVSFLSININIYNH